MTMYFESDYDKKLREQKVGNVVKDYGIWDRPKVGSITANVEDLMNDSIPSPTDTIINVIIKKTRNGITLPLQISIRRYYYND